MSEDVEIVKPSYLAVHFCCKRDVLNTDLATISLFVRLVSRSVTLAPLSTRTRMSYKSFIIQYFCHNVISD